MYRLNSRGLSESPCFRPVMVGKKGDSLPPILTEYRVPCNDDMIAPVNIGENLNFLRMACSLFLSTQSYAFATSRIIQ